MKRFVRPLAVAMSMALPFTVSAQSPAANDADMKEIARYTLTMETVHKFEKAMGFMMEEAKKDPKYATQIKLKAQIDSLEKKDELTDDEQTKLDSLREQLERAEAADNTNDMSRANTIAEMADAASKMPIVANSLRRAGLTPREYAVFTMAFLQASMYQSMKQAGIKEVPKEMNPANAKFVDAHMAELAAMQERMKGASKK